MITIAVGIWTVALISCPMCLAHLLWEKLFAFFLKLEDHCHEKRRLESREL